jgi:hypothetical protein
LTNPRERDTTLWMTKRAIFFLLVSAGTFLTCGTTRAQDRAEFKGSTSVELPKPKRTVDDMRKMNSSAGRPELDGSGISAPPVENSPLANRKIREELDKKKNWIFMNPYEDHFDSKTAEFMKGEKGTGLYDSPLMQEGEKTAVQKFLEEKDKNRDGTRDDSRKERESNSSEGLADRARSLNNREDEEADKEKTSAFGPAKTKFDTTAFRTGSSDPFALGSESKVGKNPLAENPFGPQKSTLSAFDRDELKQRQINHEREFDQMLQTRPGSGAALGRVDVLNPAADIGRLDFNSGSSSHRMDSLLPGSRGGGASPNTAIFTDGAGVPGGKTDFGRSFGADTLTALPARPASPFSPAPAQLGPAPNAGAGPAPFILQFPKRQF